MELRCNLHLGQIGTFPLCHRQQPEADRVPFQLYVDEFQNFSTDSFASILAEARKYRLSLTLSHQYIDQLTPALRSAVLGNVGNLIAFRVGHTDAAVLANEFGNEIRPDTFVDLPRFQALAKMQEHNEPQPTFKARLMPAMEMNSNQPNKLIHKSRDRFATGRIAVEGRIQRWLRQ